jgi:ribosomal protein L15E
VYRVRIRRGGRKRPVPKGIVYGKPKHQGITQLSSRGTRDLLLRRELDVSLVDSGFSTLTG